MLYVYKPVLGRQEDFWRLSHCLAATRLAATRLAATRLAATKESCRDSQVPQHFGGPPADVNALGANVPLIAHSWHQPCRGDAAVPPGLVRQIDMNHHVLHSLQQNREFKLRYGPQGPAQTEQAHDFPSEAAAACGGR